MEKTIKIDKDTSLRLTNNVGWCMTYKDQFGRDIVPMIIPVLNAGIDLTVEISKIVNDTGVDAMEIMKRLDSDTIRDALFDAAGLEFVDFINVIWSMAKAADEDIEEPREWVKQFNSFPLDVILPQVFTMVTQGMLSTKNWKRLQAAIKSLKPNEETKK